MGGHVLDTSVQHALLCDVEGALGLHQRACIERAIEPGNQYVTVLLHDEYIPSSPLSPFLRHTSAHRSDQSHIEARLLQFGAESQCLSVNARFWDIDVGVAFMKSLIALCDSTYTPASGTFGLTMSVVPLVTSQPMHSFVGDRQMYERVMGALSREHLLFRPESSRGTGDSSGDVWLYGRTDVPHVHWSRNRHA